MSDRPLSVLLLLFSSRACRDVFTYRYNAMNLKSAAPGRLDVPVSYSWFALMSKLPYCLSG